jgi:hypothetical protein
MSADPSVNRYPSVEEFAGWYNLGYERPDGRPVLHSRERVPEFEHAEFFELYVAENQWFEQLVPPSVRKPFDPIADPPMFVRSDADVRTLDVDPDLDYLTVDLIRRIQTEFLGRYPLWRVILTVENPTLSIVIYPDAVRFGNLPLGVDPDEALRQLLHRAFALRERSMRPARDQLTFLRRRLPDAVRAIGDRLVMVVGVLDNNRGDYERLTVFLLVRGADQSAIDVGGPPGVDDDVLMTGGGFSVDAEGTIVNDEERPDAVEFSVLLWYPPADYRGQFTIVEFETGKRHTYDLASEHITRTAREK